MKSVKFSRRANVDAPIVVETVEMYLARGGQITKCPPKSAENMPMYVPCISVEGYHLPLNVTIGAEYLPNFVNDVTTYDRAQSEQVTAVDDGSVELVRDDERRSIRPTIDWVETRVKRNGREGADMMEEL